MNRYVEFVDEFVDKIIGLIKDKKELKEIARKQRHLGRPSLGDLFDEEVLKEKRKWNKRIYEAVTVHGYSQS